MSEMRIDNKIQKIWKDYKYCLSINSQWLQLYKNKDDFLTIYSTETNKDEVIGMKLFNDISDFYMNSEFGFLYKNDLFDAIKKDFR